MLAHKGLSSFVFGLHVLQFGEALLEFLTSGRVLGNRGDQLDVVESSLFVKVVK